jgi:cell surface protein SprA
VTPEPTDRGQLLWFSPNTVQVGELTPREDARNERNDIVPTLEVIYVPYEGAGVNGSWGGLVTPISQIGQDLTEAQFLEVWVNDYVTWENRDQRRGELLIDVGSVSEDAVWDPLTPPGPPTTCWTWRTRTGAAAGST